MPRRSILSAADRDNLLAIPDAKDELIRHYTLSESDLAIIRQHRGGANRLGFAVQLCYLRHPGVAFGADEIPFPPLLRLVAVQLKIDAKVAEECWGEYGQRDQTDKRLYLPDKPSDPKTVDYPALTALIGGTINRKQIRSQWDQTLRLAASIRQATVTASLMLRKLGSYPRQNGQAVALRGLGRIERTLFTLDWLQDVELRRRVHAGLNKGEVRNAPARAVSFNRLGEMRDRSFDNQRYRAIQAHGQSVDENLLQHLSPLGREHISLTGDYVWRQSRKVEEDKYRPLRPMTTP